MVGMEKGSFFFPGKQDRMHLWVDVKSIFLEWQVAGFTLFHCLCGP